MVELAAAEALMGMRISAAAGDWARVESLLEVASRQSAGNEWATAVLEAKDESISFSVAESASVPAYLRRKPAQGKGEV